MRRVLLGRLGGEMSSVAATLQESLVLAVVDVADDHGGTERVDDVRVVRVEEERLLLHSCRTVRDNSSSSIQAGTPPLRVLCN